jgi:hypothetical protein
MKQAASDAGDRPAKLWATPGKQQMKAAARWNSLRSDSVPRKKQASTITHTDTQSAVANERIN